MTAPQGPHGHESRQPFPVARHANAAEVFVPEASLSNDPDVAAATLLVLTYKASTPVAATYARWYVEGVQGNRRLATLIAACDLAERLPEAMSVRIYFQNPMTADVARGDRVHAETPGAAMASAALTRLLERNRARGTRAFDVATAHRSTAMTRVYERVSVADDQIDLIDRIRIA